MLIVTLIQYMQSIWLSANLKYKSMPQGVEHNNVKYFSLLCSNRYIPLMPRGDPKVAVLYLIHQFLC